MKLIKIDDDHYVVVDDSEIKEGDFVYDTITNTIWTWEKYTENEIDSKYSGKVFKITHSTQPLEISVTQDNKVFDKIKPLSLQEIKELIGEVDLEKSMWYERNVQNPYPSDSPSHTGFKKGFELGYNQALEDNEEKKHTKADIRVAIRLATTSKYDHRLEFYSEEEILRFLQTKTEWDVEWQVCETYKLDECNSRFPCCDKPKKLKLK